MLRERKAGCFGRQRFWEDDSFYILQVLSILEMMVYDGCLSY